MMSVNGIGRGSTRIVRKIEAPRPLKASSINESKYKSSALHSSLSLTSLPIESVEKLVTLMDMVVNSIMQSQNSRETNPESMALLTTNIIHLCKHLKIFGPQLENLMYQGQLDRAFLAFREGMVRGCLEYEARIHLLEIVELRDCHWIPRKALSQIGNSYNHPLQDLDDFIDGADLKSHSRYYPLSSVDSTSNLGQEDVLKRSNKHRDKLIKIGSKHYYKDEIIIRNSDSGKVMGIKGRRVHMIEQLSETIISFQRVPPTAKERTVQITGPSDDRISYATRLIEDTIRSNSSPIREICGSDSSCSSEESFNDPQDYENERNSEELLRDTPGTNSNLDPCSKWKSNSNKSVEPYQYKHKVIVRNCQLTITGDDYTYVTVAKAILDDYFSKLRNNEQPDDDDTYSCNNDVFVDKFSKQNDEHKAAPRDIFAVPKKSDFPSPLITGMPDISADAPVHQESFSFLRPKSVSATSQHKPDVKIHVDATRSASLSAPEEIVPVLKMNANEAVTAYPIPSLGGNEVNNGSSADSLPSAEHESRNVYSKEFLISCRESELSRKKPKDWDSIAAKFPDIAKHSDDYSEEYNAEGNSI